MKLIKPYFKILEQQTGLEGLYRQIELCGRVAYKSEDKITEDSYKEFIDRIIKLNHGTVLEQGTLYLDFTDNIVEVKKRYINNPYSKIYKNTLEENWDCSHLYITTNMRVLVEHNWLNDLKYLCEPTKYHEKRVCIKFVLPRSIAQQFTRHRVFSFLMESQRYCNYSKNKFNNEVTFIIPCGLDIKEVENYRHWADKYEDVFLDEFLCALQNAETSYLSLINCGWTPQEAREVLPNATKTELIMTGYISDWKNFFNLRCSKNAQLQARELAIPLKEEFIKRSYINE